MLGIQAADCAPVLFADAEAGVIGAAHAGWKGAFGGVLEAVIAAMEKLGARRAAIAAAIGPSICKDNYEVGGEFRENFLAQDPANAAFFTARDGRFRFGLPAYVLDRLARAGIADAADLGLCTYPPENRFFSFRRTTHRGEADYGRQISAIVPESKRERRSVRCEAGRSGRLKARHKIFTGGARVMADQNGSRGMRLIAGNSNPALATAIGQYLKIEPVKSQVRRFADMEVFVEIQENVRGEDMFVIQSTSYPANDNLMELLIMIDALRRASARRITAVIPYFGYARQDRKVGPRTPISAKLVANMITEAGANRVLTVDLHAGQIQGFFDIPTDNLFAMPVIVKDITDYLGSNLPMVVSPDVGGVVRARALARRLGTDLAIVDKRRERAGESEVMNIIGDVEGRACVLIDDIVDSGGTISNAAEALLKNGATEVYAYATHGVLSGGAVARIKAPSSNPWW